MPKGVGVRVPSSAPPFALRASGGRPPENRRCKECPPALASDGPSNDRYRVDLYEVARRHYRYPDHHIGRFVISKQRNLRFFDDRYVFVALVIDNLDCDLANLLGPCACRAERSAEIAECQARLRRKIAMPNELAVYVFGLLTRDEYELGSRSDDTLCVHLWNWQIIRVDEFERH